MANSSLLVLCQQALQSLGVFPYGQPTTIIGNTDQDITQMLAQVNIEGNKLARESQWQAQWTKYNFTATYYTYTGDTTDGSTSLTNMSSIASLDATFQPVGTNIPQDTFISGTPAGTTVVMTQAATETATGTSITFSKTLFPFPADYDRTIDRTHWDKSKHWEMLGPETPQQAEWLRNGYISTGPRVRFWPMGGYFQIWPPLGSTELLSYDYMSRFWILATAATNPAPTKQYFTVDTDTCIFPDALMTSLIQLKYFAVKGFDTTDYFREYRQQLDLAKSFDAGNRTLSMNPQPADVLLTWANIPDSGYNQ